MNTNPQDEWDDCPPGTLANLPPRAAKGLRRSPFAVGVIVGAAACLLFAAFSPSFTRSQDSPFATLPCEQVLPQLAQLKAGTLDEDTIRELERHLAVCDKCRATFAALAKYQSMPTQQLWAADSIEIQRAARLLASVQP